MGSDDPDMGSVPDLAPDSSEADLVDAARRGDHGAWEALYRSVYPGLRAFMYRRVGAAHVEDAVSETMTRAVAGIDRFQLGPVGFAGWVYGIGRRVAADHYRRAGRQARQEEAAVRGMDLDGPAPLDSVLEDEDRAALRTAFGLLSADEQELLELRVVGGLSADAVAAALGKRAGAVRTAQYRPWPTCAASSRPRRARMAERPEDTRLLAALAQALSGDLPAPPPEGLTTLHAAVDRRVMGQSEPSPARPFGRLWEALGNLRWRRPAGVAAIVAGSVVAGGGVAFASGAPVPPPIRELATHLGLPVTPQTVVNVHNTESSLSKALQHTPTGNPGGTETVNSAISHYAGTLRRQVSELTPPERQSEDPKAQQLLNQAARQNDHGGSASTPGSRDGGDQSGARQDQNGRSGPQNGSTDGSHDSGSSRSGGDGSQQGAGGSGGLRYDTSGDHFSTTTAVMPRDRRDGSG